MAIKDTHEPTKRNWVSFWSLMGLQAQNAFNDKALQFTLVPLGAYVAAQSGAEWGKTLPHLLGMLILLPFILFAPLSGWASDTFSKTRVIRLTAWLQLAVLLVVLGSIGVKFLPLTVICFFFLAVQSTILSPAKNGIIKELLGSARLGFASGIMQMFTILAILAGQILIGIWFSDRQDRLGDGWLAAQFPMVVITGGAVVTLVMAYSIQVMPAQGGKPFRSSLLLSHFKQLGELFHSVPLRLSALGIAYFWAFGTIMQFITIQISGELYPAGDSNLGRSLSYMMLAASGGIALGSIVGAMINKHHIELGLNPLGGIIMVISTAVLVFATPETGLFYAALCGAGVGVAFFFVPINAFLQDECDPSQRGNILAASALLNCLAMAVAVVLQLAMLKAGLSPQLQFLLVGLTVVGATWYVMRLLPAPFLKLLVLSGLRAVYRIQAIHPERMPKKGGILLAANHFSYLDALVITAACPRPVRFIMIRDYFETPLVGWIARLFNTIPISRERAKDAIRVAAEAVEEGNVVCLFPEGQLSRSGMMNEIRKGFELIARRAKCPVQAVYLDGLWKSIFSCERGRFFWKMPRAIPFGVRVGFGPLREAAEMDADELRREFQVAAGEVFAQRRELAADVEAFLKKREATARALTWWHREHLSSCTWGDVRQVVEGISDPAELTRGHRGATAWLEEWRDLAALPAAEFRRLTINALQVADPSNLGRGKTPVLLDHEAPEAVRRVWGMLLPALVKTYAVSFGPDDNLESFGHLLDHEPLRDLVGGERMRDLLLSKKGEFDHLCWYRFGGPGATREDIRSRIFAGHEQDGRVIALSMPHAPFLRERDEFQPGWREGSPGRLLTAFVPRDADGALRLEGEMVEDAIELPGWDVDEHGFLVKAAD